MKPQLAIAALLAAGGMAAGGFYLWPSGSHVSACKPFVQAAVPAAAKKALAAFAGEIRHDVMRTTNGVLFGESWDDTLLNRERYVDLSDGKVSVEAVVSRRGDVERTVMVGYEDRTWTTTRRRVAATAGPANTAADIAKANRDEVASGKATVVGRERLDGREVLHLRQVIHPQAPTNIVLPRGIHTPKLPAFRVDTWVDPLTYLTLRARIGEGAHAAVTVSTWLPRTPANLAKTRLVIPRGFRHRVPGANGVSVTMESQTLVAGCAQS